MYAINLNNDNRILLATYPEYAPADAVLVDDLPDGDISDYLYINGEYVYDPIIPPRDIPAEIAALKSQLAATDYAVIKIAEGAATREEYTGIIAQRQEWRTQINELGAELNG